MKKKPKHLHFISRIKRDGSGTEPVTEDMLDNILNDQYLENKKFKINCLSIGHGTFIASGFNSYVVKLKKQPKCKP